MHCRIHQFRAIAKISLFFIIFLTLTGCAGVGTKVDDKTADLFKTSPPLMRFKVGEIGTYKVKWIGIPVAAVTTTIRGIEKVDGRDAYFVELTIKTNGWCDFFYKIRDRFRTYIDVEKLIPLKNEILREEGSYRKNAATIFDHENGKAYFENFKDGSKKVIDIPPNVQDTVSAFYYTRTINGEVGEKISFSVDHAEKIYLVEGVIEKKSYVELPGLGRLPAVFTEPKATIGGKTGKAGTSKAYFGAGELRAPLIITIKAPLFTSLTAMLDKVEMLSSAELSEASDMSK